MDLHIASSKSDSVACNLVNGWYYSIPQIRAVNKISQNRVADCRGSPLSSIFVYFLFRSLSPIITNYLGKAAQAVIYRSRKN